MQTMQSYDEMPSADVIEADEQIRRQVEKSEKDILL
jgi:hypothetical protein